MRKKHPSLITRTRYVPECLALAICLALCGCTRENLRWVINKLGSKEQEKPAVYHEYEGYSPGARKSKALEDFNRYYYYISPDKEELVGSDPEIYFQQDYEVIEATNDFDEEQYWREHPLNFDNEETTTNNI